MMAKADRKKGAGKVGGSIYDNTDFSRYELGGGADERKGLYDNTDFSRYCLDSKDYCAEKVKGLPEGERQGALAVLGQLNDEVKDSERRQVFDDYLAYRAAVQYGRFKDAPQEEFGPGLQGFLLKRGEAAGDRKRYFGKESAVRRELTAEEERARAAEEAKRKAASLARDKGADSVAKTLKGYPLKVKEGEIIAQDAFDRTNIKVRQMPDGRYVDEDGNEIDVKLPSFLVKDKLPVEKERLGLSQELLADTKRKVYSNIIGGEKPEMSRARIGMSKVEMAQVVYKPGVGNPKYKC